MRLFYALWPDDDVRRALARWGDTCFDVSRGRRVPPENLHVTLAFLGEIAAQKLPALTHLGATLPAAGFDLVFDRVGWFRRSRIVYAGVSLVPPALVNLADAMKSALEAAGLRTEARPFVPHVTLLRDVRDAPPVMRPAAKLLWQVRHIALVESLRGSNGQVYRPVRSFILSG